MCGPPVARRHTAATELGSKTSCLGRVPAAPVTASCHLSSARPEWDSSPLREPNEAQRGRAACEPSHLILDRVRLQIQVARPNREQLHSCGTIDSYIAVPRTLLGASRLAHVMCIRWRRTVPELKSAPTKSSLGQQYSTQVLGTPSTPSVGSTRHRNRIRSITTHSTADASSRPHLIQQRPSSSQRLTRKG